MIHTRISDYLEALLTLYKSEQRQIANDFALQPIHLQILQYLGRCNRYSDSLLVLCEFLGQTKGSLSTSVSLLEKKGLVCKQASAADKRKSSLKLTAQGVEIYARQRAYWDDLCSDMSSAQRATLEQAFDTLLRALQQANQGKMFGVCTSCKHLVKEANQHSCGLTGEALQPLDLQQICVHHSA